MLGPVSDRFPWTYWTGKKGRSSRWNKWRFTPPGIHTRRESMGLQSRPQRYQTETTVTVIAGSVRVERCSHRQVATCTFISATLSCANLARQISTRHGCQAMRSTSSIRPRMRPNLASTRTLHSAALRRCCGPVMRSVRAHTHDI